MLVIVWIQKATLNTVCRSDRYWTARAVTSTASKLKPAAHQIMQA